MRRTLAVKFKFARLLLILNCLLLEPITISQFFSWSGGRQRMREKKVARPASGSLSRRFGVESRVAVDENHS